MRRRLIVVAILASGCASQPKPTTEPTPVPPGTPPPATPLPPPPPATAQTVRLGPSALRYVAHQVIHIEQEFQGIRQPLDFGLRTYFRVTITGPADSTGYPTTVTIDSVVPDSGMSAPPGFNVAAAKGLSFMGRLTPAGDFRISTPTDSATTALTNMINGFRNFFPRLPAAGAAPGATWTDTTTQTDRSSGTVVVKSISRWHAAGWEDRGGVRSLRIEITSNFDIQGAGEQNGQPFEIAGSGVRTGTDYLAVDGRFLGGEARDSTSMTITLPVQSMTIPRTQVSRSTVMVVP